MGRSRGRPAAVAGAGLVLALGLGAGGLGAAAAPPRACGECGGCNKKRCLHDDGCFYDAAARTCQDVGPDQCRGVQTRHGRKASPAAGGPGRKKKRCVATSGAVGGSTSQCVCLKKDGTPSPMNRKGLPRTCRLCRLPAPPGEDLEGGGGGGGGIDSPCAVAGVGADGRTPRRMCSVSLKAAVASCLAADATGANCRHDGIPISDWDVSRVTDMSELFKGAREFNADISKWNTAAVSRMDYMFRDAWRFNQDISSWNTAAVTTMYGMFTFAKYFNQDISKWNTAAVIDMRAMFNGAGYFNQDISSWNTAAVKDMGFMFAFATDFNQDISSWNTAAVTSMKLMFWGAKSFNQDISTWDVMAVTDDNFAMFAEGHSRMTYYDMPCTATGVGADGRTRWRKC